VPSAYLRRILKGTTYKTTPNASVKAGWA